MCYVDEFGRQPAALHAHACTRVGWPLVEIFVCSRSCSPCFSRPPSWDHSPDHDHFRDSRHHQNVPPQSSHNGQNTWSTTAGASQAPTTRQHVGLGGILDHRKEWVRRSEASCEQTGGTHTSRPGETELVHHISYFHCTGPPNTWFVCIASY